MGEEEEKVEDRMTPDGAWVEEEEDDEDDDDDDE